LDLGGLGVAEGRVLLADKQLSGNTEEWTNLIARFGGNGLALKLVGESIRRVFGGDIGAFLDAVGSSTVFGGMRRLLAVQLERSSSLEQQVLRVLAVEREPVTASELIAELGPRAGRAAVLESVEALRRRSLVERSSTTGPAAVHPLVGFTLQSVVLEYVTDRLVEEVCDEITLSRPVLLVAQPLIKAQAKDYVRQAQERLICLPVLQHLQADRGSRTEQLLLALLEGWRSRPSEAQGYGPGNVVNLLRLLRGDLRGLDLADLAIRQAYLAGVEAQDASLAGASLSESLLPEAFDFLFSVALSVDGAFLAAGTTQGELRLWRVADRTPLLAVQGHTSAIYGLALSANGRLLASGASDGTVRLWEAPFAVGADESSPARPACSRHSTAAPPSGGRLLATLQAHTCAIYGLALSADGRLLASGASDGTVRLWEAPFAVGDDESSPVRTAYSRHSTAAPPSGAASDRSDQFAERSADSGDSRAAPPSGGRLLATLLGHTAPVVGVAFSADGHLLASGSWDGTVRVWSLTDVVERIRMPGIQEEASSGRPLATLQGHTGPVGRVSLGADGRLLASSSWDGTIRLWEMPGGQPLATLKGHTGAVYDVALSRDGRLLASSGEDATVRLWEVPGGQPLATLQGHAGPVYGVALSADGRLVTSGGKDATVRLWESGSRRLLATLHGLSSGVWGVALSADGRLVASGSSDGLVRLWEANTGRLLATLHGHTGGVWGVALSADGRLLVSGGEGGTIRMWEVPGGRLLATLEIHTGPVYGVAMNADAWLLASGGQDGTVRLWSLADVRDREQTMLGMTDASSPRLLTTLRGHTNAVWAVALSADGRLLASGSLDGTVRLWSVADLRPGEPSMPGMQDVPFAELERGEPSPGRTADSGDSPAASPSGGQLLATLQAHTGPVYGVAFNADGRLLVSGSEDATVRLWEVPGGQPLATLQGHTGSVLGVALSADGRLLTSSSQDGTVRLWDAPGGQLVATLQGHTRAVQGIALTGDGRVLASGGLDGTVRLWEPSSGACLRVLRSDRRYERVDITGLTGVTAAQRATLLNLGAIDHQGTADETPAGVP
jgi:WD40 repeat protein